MLLTFAFTKVSDPWSVRQQCHLIAISEYTTIIRLIAGKSYLMADAMCRTIINDVHNLEPEVDFMAVAAAQRNDGEMATHHSATSG